MITNGMTYKEIADVVRRDFNTELKAGYNSFFGMKAKYEHEAKRNAMPGRLMVLGTREKVTREQNKYVFIFLIFGKEHFKMYGVQALVRLEYHMNDGVHVANYNVDNDSVTFYTPHFFERFKERYLKDEEMPMTKVRHTYAKCDIGTFFIPLSRPKYENNVLGACEYGVNLGAHVYQEERENIVEYRTFITYDMIKGDEIGLTGVEYMKLKRAKRELTKALHIRTYELDVITEDMEEKYKHLFEYTVNKKQCETIEIEDWNGQLELAGLNLYHCSVKQKIQVRDTLSKYMAFVFGEQSVNIAKVAGIVAVNRFKEEYPDQYIEELEDFCHEGAYMAYVSLLEGFVSDYADASEEERKILLENEQDELSTILCNLRVELNDGKLLTDDECNHFLNGAMYGVAIKAENLSAKDMLKELFPFLTDLNFTGGYFE